MASGPWNIPNTNRISGIGNNYASIDSSSPLSMPIRPSPRRATLNASRERLSSALNYEPRIILADSYSNRDPGCVTEGPSGSSGSIHHPSPASGRGHRPSVAIAASAGRSPTSIGPRRSSLSQQASTSYHHGPHIPRNPPQKAPTRTRSSTFTPPTYLDYSILRSKMITEPHSDEPAEPKQAINTRRRRTVSHVLSDSEDDEERSPSPVPFRISHTTTPTFYTRPEDGILRLPSRWSEESRNRSLNVSSDGREITFSVGGTSGPEDGAASVRANHPIPPACGVYYYEIVILKAKGGTGAGGKAQISIGFSSPSTKTSSLPGWEKSTWGYHGDDGNAFGSGSPGFKYGPTFGGRDVVGCGINFATKKGFFTKNGDFLNDAFHDLPLSGTQPLLLYPSVGLQKPGDSIQVNFGQSPFMFDIDTYAQQAKEAAWKAHQDNDNLKLEPLGKNFSSSLPERAKEEKRLLEHLVLEYLEHHGYVGTANVFKENAGTDLSAREVSMEVDGDEDTTNIVRRTDIVNAVRRGDIDTALEGLQRWFPTVLRSETQDDGKLSVEDTLWLKLRCRKFVELVLQGVELKKKKAKSTTDGMDIDDWTSLAYDDLLHRAITYGQNLQSDYRQVSDTDPRVRDLFNMTFGIVAWQDPIEAGGLVAEVAGIQARYTLAEEVRTSILKSQGLSTQPMLETVYRRANVCLAELAMIGQGSAAYVDLQKEFGSGEA